MGFFLEVERKRLAQHPDKRLEDGVPVLQDEAADDPYRKGRRLTSVPKDLNYMAAWW
jgi:hypothetical protein